MTDIIMIKVFNDDNKELNLNMAYISAVELESTDYMGEKIYMTHGPTVQLPEGGWADAVNRLIADYDTIPKVRDHLFIGVT